MNPDFSRTVNLKVNDRGYNDSNEDDDDDFNDDQALTLASGDHVPAKLQVLHS